MKITIAKRFARNGKADENDTRQIKKALNRLGYYQPSEKQGITEIPDAKVFEALKKFQMDHGLPITGTIKPGDDTDQILKREAKKDPSGYYIWRTVGDDKVRHEHARLNGTPREWGDFPDPGDDFNCRCWAEKLSNSVEKRKLAILRKGKADFTLKPDPHPISKAPIYSLDYLNEVDKYKREIEVQSKKENVDSDLIKAIIYVETTQGFYDYIAYVPVIKELELNKTIRPMNIHVQFWKDLGYSREDLENPRLNIKAGIDLIKRIQYHMPNSTIEEIATIYNDLNARMISDYGARVARVMKEKPWLQKK